MSRKDWKQSNRIIWLVKIDVDRGEDFPFGLIKVIPQKKKLSDNFFSLSLSKIKKKGHPAFFERNDGPNLPHFCLYDLY